MKRTVNGLAGGILWSVPTVGAAGQSHVAVLLAGAAVVLALLVPLTLVGTPGLMAGSLAVAMVAYTAMLSMRTTAPLRRENVTLSVAHARIRAEAMDSVSAALERVQASARDGERGYAGAVRRFIEAQSTTD